METHTHRRGKEMSTGEEGTKGREVQRVQGTKRTKTESTNKSPE